MKNLILIAFLLLVSAVVSQAQDEKMNRKERKALKESEAKERTQKLIEEKNWMFEARHMLPARGTSRSLTTYYGVKYTGEEVESFLPFFGRAYRTDYGSMTSPLDFKSEVYEYSIDKWKKGGWIIRIDLKNKSDILKYTFTIADTGSATLDVSSTDREHISYQGEITEIPQKK